MSAPDAARLEAVILEMTAERGAEKSICPSEVARAFGDEWRGLMKPVRAAAVTLARAGRIEILRKGKPVADIEDFRGVIRLRVKLPPGGAQEA